LRDPFFAGLAFVEVLQLLLLEEVAFGAEVDVVSATAAFAVLVPCEMRTQFPKPPSVVNETRQLAPSDPPVHFVPAGRAPVIWTEPTVVGARTPFFVMLTALEKDLPVAVVSTVADLISVEPSWPPLKFCTVTVKASLVAFTAVDLARTLAMLTEPHGEEVDGRCTSERAPAPVTPIGGSIKACP